MSDATPPATRRSTAVGASGPPPPGPWVRGERGERPVVALVGRLAPSAEKVRGEALAIGRRYLAALRRAGAVPVVLEPTDHPDGMDALLRRVEALVLVGGGDVDPARYGAVERRAEVYGVETAHDATEIAAVLAAVRLDLPVLAVCRGLQVMNVALGGTLVQHLDLPDHRDSYHRVDAAAGSQVAAAMGTTTARPHSVHHQAIDRLADDLVVVARAPDGTIEAAEHRHARWIVGVQWHPEDTADGDPTQQGLFDALVRVASTRR